jgi:hypothetical protein
MLDGIYYLPIATTFVSVLFAWHVFQRWSRKHRPPHLAWWSAGVAMFGAGTFFEAYTALFGWYEWAFRGWYITGALLGAAPLALGTVYLLMPLRTANLLAASLVAYVSIAALCVLLTPLDASLADDKKLSGEVIEWTWVRAFSPLVNTFAFVFLVGGAIASVARYRREGNAARAWANVWIAIGAILPGIGGSFTRAGYTEVLYVTEFLGILLIAWGYRESIRASDRDAVPRGSSQPLPAA